MSIEAAQPAIEQSNGSHDLLKQAIAFVTRNELFLFGTNRQY
jgi:hypothetical protein